MIKIAILTNQQTYLNQIKELTKKSMPLRYELKEYMHPQNLFDDLAEDNACDLFLLDMEMPGYSPFETARRIKTATIASEIIYITNQVEYAAGNYEVNPYRYIPKKQLVIKLPEAYKFICERIAKRKKEILYYTIENDTSFERISYPHIYYLKKKGKFTLIVHKNGQSKTGKKFPEVLKEFMGNPCFSAISKNCAVNILHVMSFKNHQIHLRDGSILTVDPKNKEQFIKDIVNCGNS